MSEVAPRPFLLLNDLPVEDEATDLLDMFRVAQELANLIHNSVRNTPFVLSVNGHWGAGKSTLMRQLSNVLAARGDVEVVWFNAWTASGVSALTGMLKLVLGKLDRNIVRRSFRRLNSGGLLSGAFRIGITAVGGLFRVDRAIDQLWDRMSVDAKAREEARQLMQSAMQSWIDESTGAPRRTIVVFVDDLDRCGETTAIEICEAIKLYLDLPGIAFVLGCDLDVLSRLSLPGAGSPQQVRDYLEKIVQVNYQIPVPRKIDVERMVRGYAAQSRTEHLLSETTVTLIGRQSGGNPRRIKRVINSFVTEYQLASGWRKFGAEGLMKAVILQHFYPEFYQEILTTTDDTAGHLIDYRTLRDRLLRGSIETQEDITTSLLQKYPVQLPEVPDQAAIDRALNQLNERVPRTLRQLVDNEDLLALLRDFGDPLERRRLQEQLRGRPLSTTPSTPEERGEEESRFGGLRLLWIDDNPAGNESLINALVAHGAQVRTSTDVEQALRLIPGYRPNAIVSDVNRHGRESGFDDIEAIRATGYTGPVLFFTSRVTADWQQRSDAVGAAGITSAPGVVMDWLEAHAASLAPTNN